MEIPGYEIQRVLGSGGMATVYLAIQQSLRRPVALKVMSESLTTDKSFTKRFLREGRIVASLEHPNIITVHAIDVADKVPYMVMEYVEGGTLQERIRSGMSVGEVLGVMKQIIRALGFAHDRGIIHRDVKPGNILFHRNGRPLLSDFGIAKAVHDDFSAITRAMTLGTPDYMSPEQARGTAIDARTDQYALGAVLYKCLTGRKPFAGSNPVEIAIRHTTDPVPRLEGDLTIIQPLLDRMMAKEPDDRYPDDRSMLEDLRRVAAAYREQSARTPSPVEATAGRSPVVPATVDEDDKTPVLPEGRGSSPRRSKRTPLRLAALGAAVVLTGAVYLFADSSPDEPPRPVFAIPEPEPAEETVVMIDEPGREVAPEPVATVAPAVRMPVVEIPVADPDPPAQQIAEPEPPPRLDPRLFEEDMPLISTGSDWIESITAPEPIPEIEEPAESLSSDSDSEAIAAEEAADDAAAEAFDIAAVAEPDLLGDLLDESPDETGVDSEQAEPSEIDRLLVRADENLAANRLTVPAGNNAFEDYRRVLALDAGNAAALRGLEAIAERYVVLVRRELDRNNLDRADQFVERGLVVRPGQATLIGLAQRIGERRAAAERPPSAVAEPEPAPAVDPCEADRSSRECWCVTFNMFCE